MPSRSRLRIATEEEIPYLAKIAEKFLPQSTAVHGYLTVGFKYKSNVKLQSRIYVPDEENSPFFIAITRLYGKSTNSSLAVFWEINTLPKSVIAGYLSNIPEMSSKKPIIFGGCDKDVLRELHSTLEEEVICGQILTRLIADDGFVYFIEDHKTIPTFELPPNFHLGEIRPDDAGIVSDTFKFDYETVENIASLIKKLPTSAIFYQPENGSPKVMVSWTLTRHNGLIGCTHTLPEFRRKNLGTIVTCDLARKHRKFGLIPHTFIDANNSESMNLHHKIAFTRATSIGWHTYKHSGHQ